MSTLTEFLTGIADAIRSKTGTSAPIPAQNFASEIEAIETGVTIQQANVDFGGGSNANIWYMQGGTVKISSSSDPVYGIVKIDIDSLLGVGISSSNTNISISGSIRLLSSTAIYNQGTFLYKVNGDGSITLSGGSGGSGSN